MRSIRRIAPVTLLFASAIACSGTSPTAPDAAFARSSAPADYDRNGDGLICIKSDGDGITFTDNNQRPKRRDGEPPSALVCRKDFSLIRVADAPQV